MIPMTEILISTPQGCHSILSWEALFQNTSHPLEPLPLFPTCILCAHGFLLDSSRKTPCYRQSAFSTSLFLCFIRKQGLSMWDHQEPRSHIGRNATLGTWNTKHQESGHLGPSAIVSLLWVMTWNLMRFSCLILKMSSSSNSLCPWFLTWYQQGTSSFLRAFMAWFGKNASSVQKLKVPAQDGI